MDAADRAMYAINVWDLEIKSERPSIKAVVNLCPNWA